MKKKEEADRLPGKRRETSADILGSNSEIGRKLRQLYDEVVSEDVPDRFAQLLNQLDKVETSSDRG